MTTVAAGMNKRDAALWMWHSVLELQPRLLDSNIKNMPVAQGRLAHR